MTTRHSDRRERQWNHESQRWEFTGRVRRARRWNGSAWVTETPVQARTARTYERLRRAAAAAPRVFPLKGLPWEGRARMARARCAAGVYLDPIDIEALEREESRLW